MEGPGVRSVDNETNSQSSRVTKDNKKLTYKLQVLQQPQIARACGSGAKSSADRRPVDPPPIVELKILEGEKEGELRDVTFTMTANYFLFATLEQARNISHGRVQTDSRTLPVLTGTPVAGMVYLDRPSPAGYFIFPDLSVRHEGVYRLSFSLYEELKDTRDEDKDNDTKMNMAGEAHVTHRLEVMSKMFTVYSAKKFPGLTESTTLSRVVAEQGCRVRIRRDVRMRKREQKPGKPDWDGYEEENSDVRARVSATPEGPNYGGPPPPGYPDSVGRPRSASNASHQSLAPSIISRRPSLQDMNHTYNAASYGATPHTPHHGYAPTSPYASSPGQHYTQSPFMQHQPPMQPPPAQTYQPAYQAHPGLPPPPVTSQQSYYGYSAAPQHPYGGPYYDNPPHAHRLSADFSSSFQTDERRLSSNYAPPPPPSASFAPQQSQAPYQPQLPPQTVYSQPSLAPQHSHPVSYSAHDAYGNRHAPAEPVQPPLRTSGVPSISRPFNDKLPSIDTHLNSISNKHLAPSSPASLLPMQQQQQQQQPNIYQPAPVAATTPLQTPTESSHKRTFGHVFNDSHLSQPLRQGARPITPVYGHGGPIGSQHYAVINPGDEEDIAAAAPNEGDVEGSTVMTYRRANGQPVIRSIPV